MERDILKSFWKTLKLFLMSPSSLKGTIKIMHQQVLYYHIQVVQSTRKFKILILVNQEII